MGADRITLKSLVFYAYHGVFEAEKELGQKFEVDVDMRGGISRQLLGLTTSTWL